MKRGRKDSSSVDEQKETKSRRYLEGGGEPETQFPQHSASTDENARNNGIARSVEHLRNSAENDKHLLSVYLKLVSFDDQSLPRLEKPYLWYQPITSVKMLCQHVALETGLHADEVELWLVINPDANFILGERTVDPNKDELRVLGDQETLAELFSYPNTTTRGYLVLAYKNKLQNSDSVGSSSMMNSHWTLPF